MWLWHCKIVVLLALGSRLMHSDLRGKGGNTLDFSVLSTTSDHHLTIQYYDLLRHAHRICTKILNAPRHLRYPARNWTTSSRHTWLLSGPCGLQLGSTCNPPCWFSLRLLPSNQDGISSKDPANSRLTFAFQNSQPKPATSDRASLRALGCPAAKMRFLRFSGKSWPFRKMASTVLVSCHFPFPSTQNKPECVIISNFLHLSDDWIIWMGHWWKTNCI